MGPNVEEKFKVFEYTGNIKKRDFNIYPDYAILRISRDNIGPLTPLPEGLDMPKDLIPFKTPFDLVENSKVIINAGSFYGWHHRNVNFKDDNDC
jgi:hypothetical protein